MPRPTGLEGIEKHLQVGMPVRVDFGNVDPQYGNNTEDRGLNFSTLAHGLSRQPLQPILDLGPILDSHGRSRKGSVGENDLSIPGAHGQK